MTETKRRLAKRPTPRSEVVKITLRADTKRQLETLAEAMGLTPATVAAFAVGKFLAETVRTAGIIERIADQAAPEIAKAISEASRSEEQLQLKGV